MPLDIMANILPQIVNCDQANKFIDLNLNDIGKLALRVRIGPLYNAYVGLYSGHYAIDMKVAEQKNGAKRLGAICIAEGKYCREVGVNTSQKGNNSNFRNEKLGFTNMDLTGRWFSSAAAVGCTKVLHADYVSTTKPKKGQPPMSDAKFEALIERLNLDEIRVVWERLCARAKQWQNQVDSMTSSIEGILSVESSDSTTSQKSYKTVSKRRSITFNPSSFDSYPVTGDVSKPSTMPGNHNRPSTGDTNISGVDSKPSTANYSRKGKSMFESEYGEFGSAKEADKMLNNMPPMPFPINPYEFKELLIDSPFSVIYYKLLLFFLQYLYFRLFS